jgi:metallo-beta-lactamase family protein
VLLTHTHIDHAGYLPRLVREGYRGPVYCTPATRDLASLLLLDAAQIQEEDAAYANRKGYSKHAPALPLFTSEDAEAALARMQTLPYDTWLELGKGIRARFLNAGHILGSASIDVRVARSRSEIGIVFSGDVGRYDMPLHPDPMPPPPADFLVIESTYGDRLHENVALIEQLRPPLIHCFARGGVVLIPSFAVARAQLVTLILSQAMEAGELPEVPIHIDSPMAVDATRVYQDHLDEENLDPEAVSRGRRLFPRSVQFHRSVEESKRLNALEGPRIIISSSGMLAGGRVLHHARRLLPDPRNLLVLVGYQAAGTRGRALLDGARALRMHGQTVPVSAAFLVVHGLSAHADRAELLRWAKGAGTPPAAAFVIHGEPEACQALARHLERELGWTALVPDLEQRFDLDAMRGA